LLRCTEHSVIDGSMTPAHWFIEEGNGQQLLKVDFAERAFSNRDLSCYDPVFDVAGMAASLDLASSAAGNQEQRLPCLMRAAYENLSKESIGPERWLLYQLVHLWGLRQLGDRERPEVRRALSRALQRYFTEIFFKELSVPVSGELCAIDIDGVLESSPLGFSGLTPAGAATLRALTLHGYRPILATGRSLDEIRERCAAYRLAGGVAEYGSVVYNYGRDEVRELLSDRDRRDLDRLRATLTEISGVSLDRDYCRAVRAYRLDSTGKRRGLSPELVAEVLKTAEVSHRVRQIAGQAQTDFMVTTIDKSTGLRALAADLDAGGRGSSDKPLALAVGDTVSDLPMFDLAAMAFAPANADALVRGSDVMVLRRPYQSGLAMAAGRFLGHSPGGCPVCHDSPLPRDTRLLLAILAAQEAGTWGIARRALVLVARIWGIERIKNEDLEQAAK
jgi:hydroxymethylpyrimidine pyrophosphatase-like HAD family hydrolase